MPSHSCQQPRFHHISREKSHRVRMGVRPSGSFRGVGPAAHFLFAPRCFAQDRIGLPIDTKQIAGIIEPSLDAMGYRVVRVALLGARRATLQIMAERRDEADMTGEDRGELSPAVSALLE